MLGSVLGSLPWSPSFQPTRDGLHVLPLSWWRLRPYHLRVYCVNHVGSGNSSFTVSFDLRVGIRPSSVVRHRHQFSRPCDLSPKAAFVTHYLLNPAWKPSSNQKQMVVPIWQLTSFTWEMVVWGNIHFFLVVWGSRILILRLCDWSIRCFFPCSIRCVRCSPRRVGIAPRVDRVPDQFE